MKYNPSLKDDYFDHLPAEKQNAYLFLIFKKIEQSNDDDFIRLRDDFILKMSKLHQPFLTLRAETLSQCASRDIFITEVYPVFEEQICSEKDFHFLTPLHVSKHDKDKPCSDNLPLSLILHNLRSAFNVGSIIRTAECFSAEKLIFSGYTPLPVHPKVIQTSMNTALKINWEQTTSLVDCIANLRSRGYQIVALETAEPCEELYDFRPTFPLALIVGNEALGIEESVLKLADIIVRIPLTGWKNSLNVGVATALFCYEIFRQKRKSENKM